MLAWPKRWLRDLFCSVWGHALFYGQQASYCKRCDFLLRHGEEEDDDWF